MQVGRGVYENRHAMGTVHASDPQTCCWAALQQHVERHQPLPHPLTTPSQRAKVARNANAAQQLKPAAAETARFSCMFLQ
jgi:hypothetical protein